MVTYPIGRIKKVCQYKKSENGFKHRNPDHGLALNVTRQGESSWFSPLGKDALSIKQLRSCLILYNP